MMCLHCYIIGGMRGHWNENVALGLGTLAPFFEFFCLMSPPFLGGGGRAGIYCDWCITQSNSN